MIRLKYAKLNNSKILMKKINYCLTILFKLESSKYTE